MEPRTSPPTNLLRRRRRSPDRPPELAPVHAVGWHYFYAAFAEEFAQGEHVTILGPTRSGKTHLGLEVVELRDYVLFLATKPKDPLIDSLRRRGYVIQRRLEFADEGSGMPRRVVYWPVPIDGERRRLRAARDEQAEAIRGALDYAYSAGGWCVFVDESIWVADDLGLRDELTALLYQGRTLGLSMVLAAQRPAWVPRAAYSQADHLFLFQTADRDDLRRLGDIGGAQVDRIRQTVPELGEHEFLYVGTRTGTLLRSKVEEE